MVCHAGFPKARLICPSGSKKHVLISLNFNHRVVCCPLRGSRQSYLISTGASDMVNVAATAGCRNAVQYNMNISYKIAVSQTLDKSEFVLIKDTPYPDPTVEISDPRSENWQRYYGAALQSVLNKSNHLHTTTMLLTGSKFLHIFMQSYMTNRIHAVLCTYCCIALCFNPAQCFALSSKQKLQSGLQIYNVYYISLVCVPETALFNTSTSKLTKCI